MGTTTTDTSSRPGGVSPTRWPAPMLLILLPLLLAAPGCKRVKPGETVRATSDAATSHPASRPTAARQPAATRPARTVSSLPPLIDSHVHLTPLPQTVNFALRIFAEVGVKKFAVKSAGSYGTPRYRATRRIAEALGERMAFFINVDWDDIDEPGWGKREADRLERAMAEGASGIKIFKALGLGVRLKNGKLLTVDDRRLDPLWRRAAKVKAIVAWHVADPVAFFEPISKKNERYDELSQAPEWSFFGKDYPSHEALLAARDRVLTRHPKTVFLGIHLANYPENLEYVGRLLDRHENLYVDVSARVPEIGRHPADRVRAFFVKYQDRILFGTDLIVTPNGMQLGSVSAKPPDYEDAIRYYADHRRFFETAARQIAHPTPIQGRWKVDAINLPAEVLKKFYWDNADRLIFAPRRRYLAAHPTPTR